MALLLEMSGMDPEKITGKIGVANRGQHDLLLTHLDGKRRRRTVLTRASLNPRA
jgi:hypothetical protein